MVPDDADDTLIGQRIFGSYIVKKKIGAGGMGAVYVAENPDLGRKLAVKILLEERAQSRQAVARFLAEAKAASAIRHRNIIDVIDSAQLPDGRHYILMEHLEGSTLRQFARQNFPLSLEALLATLGQVCAGLQAAHDRGIIHRDLKPSNIIVAPERDNPYLVKILDFGIAKLVAPDLDSDAHTKTRTVAGTPHYMSPEQARALRDVDHRTDIYALGVIAYELVTGRPPYLANSSGDLVFQQQNHVPAQPRELCPGLPDAWNDLIMSAIDLDAARRPQTAMEMADRMIEATDNGVEIARAAAPLLFPSALSEPVSSRPDDPSSDWSHESMPSQGVDVSMTAAPPARPPRTEAAQSATPPPVRPPLTATTAPSDRPVESYPPLAPRTATAALVMPPPAAPSTTLGAVASELKTAPAEGQSPSPGGWRRPLWIAGPVLVLGVAAFVLIGRSAPGTESPTIRRPAAQPAEQTPAAPTPVTPAVEAEPVASADAGTADANIALEADAAARKRSRKRPPKKPPVEAPVVPPSDDDLFNSRK